MNLFYNITDKLSLRLLQSIFCKIMHNRFRFRIEKRYLSLSKPFNHSNKERSFSHDFSISEYGMTSTYAFSKASRFCFESALANISVVCSKHAPVYL